MLIRVRGGESGIKEYLETGRKDGRDFGRAELDERVVLHGDLEQVEQVLGVMNKSGEQYLHITLSFREDDIPEETLRGIAEDFRDFAMAAYRPDEYVFYAEAHLPRIKGYTDQRTGDAVERKPHIHIVIPEWNLLAGKQMNPLGLVENQTKVIDAFQETVNAKYGLASPKDHRRIAFTDESTMIARYKGDLFAGAGHEVKERVLGLILEKNIGDTAQLAGALAELGQVRERNAGREDSYLNVKPAGEARGVNLKDYVFSPAFLALSAAEKHARLQGDVERRYEEAGRGKPAPAELARRLAEWRERGADEVKYLNSGHKDYKAYRREEPARQAEILAALRERFYKRHDQEQNDGRTSLDAVAANVRAAARHIDAAQRANRNSDQTERNEADRRTRRIARAAVARLVGDQETAAEAGRSVTDAGSKEGRPTDSEIGQRLAQARRQPVRGHDIDRIKKSLDGSALLAYVARSHGVSVEKYAVTKGRDGGDRIVCGKRALNVSDFLTQEMRLPWKSAAALLRKVDAAEREPNRVAGQRRRSLWASFAADWRPARAKERTRAWDAQRKSEKQRRDLARKDHQAKRREIQNDKRMKGAQRKAALSIARMTKVAADAELRVSIAAERAALKDSYRTKPQDEFRLFLAEQATAGNAAALDELRRQRLPESPGRGDGFTAAPQSAEAAAFVSPQRLASTLGFRVNTRGHVTYVDAERNAVFTDTGRAVDFARRDREARELGLRLAVEKFGPKLALYGSDAYKAEMATIAAESGLRVSFADARVHARYEAEQERVRLAGVTATASAKREPEQSALLHYIEERREYKKRVPSSPDDYTQWEPGAAGEFQYEGWRRLRNGNHAVLLRRGTMIHVLPVSDEVAKEAGRLPKGRAVQVNQQGALKLARGHVQDKGQER